MKKQDFNPMPPEYEYLNVPLFEAQEQVFLIDAELERIEGDPLSEDKIVRLQDERQNVVGNLKNEFEMQTWENGPALTEQIHGIVDDFLSHDRYKAAKEDIALSGKTHQMSSYWQDKFDKNMAEWEKHSMSMDEFDHQNSLSPNFPELYEDFERE